MKSVEKDSVIHLSLQLWNEPWPYGMENEKTELRWDTNSSFINWFFFNISEETKLMSYCTLFRQGLGTYLVNITTGIQSITRPTYCIVIIPGQLFLIYKRLQTPWLFMHIFFWILTKIIFTIVTQFGIICEVLNKWNRKSV